MAGVNRARETVNRLPVVPAVWAFVEMWREADESSQAQEEEVWDLVH